MSKINKKYFFSAICAVTAIASAVTAFAAVPPRHQHGSATFFDSTISFDASFADGFESGVATTDISKAYAVQTEAQGYIWNDGTIPHGSRQSSGYVTKSARVFVDFSGCLGCFMYTYHYSPDRKLAAQYVIYNAEGYYD